MTVTVPVISDEKCDDIYEEAFSRFGLPSGFNPTTMFCALEEGGGKDSCQVHVYLIRLLITFYVKCRTIKKCIAYAEHPLHKANVSSRPFIDSAKR